MGRIFGTDGIRGVAGVDMTPELALDLGRAAATVVKERGNTHPHFLIGRDTRISGGMLESAIAAGLCSVGADVTLLGVITTPGVAYLARKYQADGAFVISASHNPYEYNGIKLFDAEGYKFPDSYEEEIEELILDDLRMYALVDGQDFGRIRVDNDARTDYVEYLASTAPARAEGIRVLVDCANGAASTTARVRTMNVQNRGLAGWRGGSMNQYSKKITIAASTPQITRDFKPFLIGYVLSFLGPPRSIETGSETTVP